MKQMEGVKYRFSMGKRMEIGGVTGETKEFLTNQEPKKHHAKQKQSITLHPQAQ